MRKYIPLVLFIFSWPVLCADIHGRVVRVLDGDTIEVMDSRKAVRIRLINIDAPEKKQDYGRWSTDMMKSLVAGKLSITRATRALTFLSELGLITYQTEYDPLIGCYIPTDITFTPALFAALDVSEDAVAAARRSRVEWENKQRKKQGLDTLGMDELIAKAWRFVRERFCSYQTELKSRGIKRARARRDANRERQDIATLVKRQLTREISEGRFSASREAVKREVERRVKERMILSRNRNYSRLATASP